MATKHDYVGGDGVYRNPFFPDLKLTPAIYWAAQAAEIEALWDMPDDARMARAMELAVKGFAIDKLIHFLGMDPVTIMGLRTLDGFTWVPNAMQPALVTYPGVVFPGATAQYDAEHAPPGSIPVSVDPKDYPPRVTAAQVPSDGSPVVGNAMGGGFYGAGKGANAHTVIDGHGFTAADGTLVIAHVYSGLMNLTSWGCYFTRK